MYVCKYVRLVPLLQVLSIKFIVSILVNINGVMITTMNKLMFQKPLLQPCCKLAPATCSNHIKVVAVDQTQSAWRKS